jgi:hypothetical protein
MVVELKAARLVHGNGKALPLVNCFFANAVVGLVIFVKAKSDKPEHVIGIGDGERIAKTAAYVSWANRTVFNSSQVVNTFTVTGGRVCPSRLQLAVEFYRAVSYCTCNENCAKAEQNDTYDRRFHDSFIVPWLQRLHILKFMVMFKGMVSNKSTIVAAVALEEGFLRLAFITY